MKSTLALLALVSTVALGRSAMAQGTDPPKAPEAAAPEAAAAPGPEATPEPETEETAPPPKTVPAPEPPKVPEPVKPPEGKKGGPSVELYALAMPFAEYVNVSGPTPRDYDPDGDGLPGPPGHIGTSQVNYTGIDAPARLRMTAGTSHFGIRGGMPLHPEFKVIAQLETAFPLDGNPNPWEAAVPNRNSFLGITGETWGTVVFGLLDSPYKWLALTTVNPIKAGYVADYQSLIGTPGFVVTGINSAQSFTGSGPSSTAFDRRDPNSVQYWSPTVVGLYARASYSFNENRQSAESGAMVTPENPEGLYSTETSPYIISVAAGFDLDKVVKDCGMCGLRLRYAWENHHDYFGLSYLSLQEAPSVDVRSADDTGNRGIAQYTAKYGGDFATRIVGIYEHLKYELKDIHRDDIDVVAGQVNMYERTAYYVLLEQTLYKHHIWGAYGKASPGSCTRNLNADNSVAPCSTDYLGAEYLMGGYMYAFSEKLHAFVMAYRLANERSALYVTTPALAREGLAPGYDQFGVGIGFYYAFSAELLH
jgi:predicted porin